MALVLARIAAVALALAIALSARAQCPAVADDAFAFLGERSCPSDPEVRWSDAAVVFDCRFFTDIGRTIDCGGDPEACRQLCRTSANVWNSDLPGRFAFLEATPSAPVAFCDPEDGRTSIGGSRSACDGTSLGRSVLAITSLFFDDGQIVEADVVVNQAFEFTPKEFEAALVHELGHVLGLDHPDECGKDFNVVMRSSDAFTPDDPCYVFEPTVADVNGAKRLYELRGALCADADLSGAVTVSDGVQTLRAAAELPSACAPSRCDVDGNGTVSVTDGVAVLRIAAGLPVDTNCPE